MKPLIDSITDGVHLMLFQLDLETTNSSVE